jgi:hypothetical protein
MNRPWHIIWLGLLALGLVVDAAPSQAQTQEMPCTDEIRQYCADVQPGGGRVLQCLKANESKLSPACMRRIDDLQATFNTPVGAACRDDWAALCYHPRASADRQAMAQCLQANVTKVSAGCQKALQEAGGMQQRQRSRGMTP